MSYRDDLDAAHARADALQRRVEELEAARAAPPAPRPRTRSQIRRTARVGAVLVVILGLGLGAAAIAVMGELGSILGAMALMCLPMAISLAVIAHQYVQADVDEALVIAGHRGVRVLMPGTGRFLVPLVERAHPLSLAPATIERTISGVYAKPGEPVTFTITALVRVRRTEDAVRRASERFLASPDALVLVASQAIEGATRAVAAELTREHLRLDADKVSEAILHEAEAELERMGLEIETLQATVA